MSAQIIELRNYQTLVTSTKARVKFPRLYRAQGYFNYDGTPSEGAPEEQTPIWYTLDTTDTGPFRNIHKVEYAPIRGFDPQIDSGWLWVRHHMKIDLAEGYAEAIGDLDPLDPKYGGESFNRRLFKTDSGIFTLVKCSARLQCADHLVIYANYYVANVPGGEKDWDQEYTIVKPDGTDEHDDEILYPSGEE